MGSSVMAVYSNIAAFAALKEKGSVVTWWQWTHGGESTHVADRLVSSVTFICNTWNASMFVVLRAAKEVLTWGRHEADPDTTRAADTPGLHISSKCTNVRAIAALEK